MFYFSACLPQFEPVGNGCYFYNPALLITSWDEAQDFCTQLQGHLVILHEGEENTALIQYILDNSTGE